MAAYKRPPLYKSEKPPQNQCQVTNNLQVSLSIQLDQSHNKFRKIEEHFTNPNRFQKQIRAKSMEFSPALRDPWRNLHHWASISAILASNSSPEATNLIRSQRCWFWEEEGKKFEDFEPTKKKKNITGSVPDFKQESVKTESNQGIPKIRIQISE